MSTCSNCKAKLSCGCQKRTASNGLSVCSNCLSQYEAKLREQKTKPSGDSPSITINSINYKKE